jgi:hypothetical protein
MRKNGARRSLRVSEMLPNPRGISPAIDDRPDSNQVVFERAINRERKPFRHSAMKILASLSVDAAEDFQRFNSEDKLARK